MHIISNGKCDMSYILPADVISPQRRWHAFSVLWDKGEGNPAYAIGKWDGNKVIVFRWNGHTGSEGGNPQNRGFPTWIVLDEDLYPAIIGSLPAEKQQIAKAYLELK